MTSERYRKMWLAAALVITALVADAQDRQVFLPKDFSDRVLRFHSDITVLSNGTLRVREQIKLFNGNGEQSPGYDRASFYFNNDIERGITRDFPTRYKDSSGYWSFTSFDVRSVTLNGVSVKHSTEEVSNGTRLKIGSEDVILPVGVYTYHIEYDTRRQLIFHEYKDEIYWNVNGNDWVFTADTVSCYIRFPEGARISEHACYTGVQNSTERKCAARLHGDTAISFTTTERLNSYEGLTVAAAIQKSIVQPPTVWDELMAFVRANYIVPLLGILLLALGVYYFYVWSKKGRDPERGLVYPQFSPPAGLTAADVGYITEQEYGPHLFAAALVECAVKRQLNIEVTRDGAIFKRNVYHFTQPPGTKSVSTKEEFGFDVQSLYGVKAEKGKYNATLRSIYLALEQALKDRFVIRRGKKNKWQGLFALNRGYVTVGLLVLIASVFLTFQYLVAHPSLKLFIISAGLLVTMLIVHIIFARIMSAYSKKGREIADHLLGFKMYLQQAEKHIYNQLAAPEKTLDLFEKYLPYAIALKVDNDWAASFDDVLQRALTEGYRPAYYTTRTGNYSGFSVNDLTRGISSGLSNTISSASTPPSSSSGGSSGGGRSGGGGGGGGGGGW